MTKIEEILVLCCRELKMSKEAMLIVMSCCQTEKQIRTMLDWIKKHYQENPSEDEILEIAEAIREQVK